MTATVAVTPPPSSGGWPDFADVEPADTRIVVASAVTAVATDLAARSGAGLATALLAAVMPGVLLGSGRVVNRRAWPVLVMAPLLGMWIALRRSGWLLPFDVLGASGLLVIGASLGRSGDPRDLTFPDLVLRGLQATVHGMLSIGFVSRALRPHGRRTPAAVVRGGLLAVPVVLVVALLLASADPVFASFFRVPTDAGDVILHVVLLALGGWLAASLLRMASATSFEVARPSWRPLGGVEALTLLGALVVVFAAFTVSQVVAVVGGDDYVRRTAGLSYAAYARGGFFQLLAAAAVTLVVLLGVRASVDLRDAVLRRRFLLTAEAAVVLTLVVVGGAIRRLGLYEQAYGWTMLRLGSVVFALWIGVLFVLLALSLTGAGGRRAWFTPAAAAAGVVALFAFNAANPETLVVRRNVDRFGGTTKLDVAHLTSLSDDAVPELVRSLPKLSPEQAVAVREFVCSGELQPTGGFWSYNASRADAAEARRAACPPPAR